MEILDLPLEYLQESPVFFNQKSIFLSYVKYIGPFLLIC